MILQAFWTGYVLTGGLTADQSQPFAKLAVRNVKAESELR